MQKMLFSKKCFVLKKKVLSKKRFRQNLEDLRTKTMILDMNGSYIGVSYYIQGVKKNRNDFILHFQTFRIGAST